MKSVQAQAAPDRHPRYLCKPCMHPSPVKAVLHDAVHVGSVLYLHHAQSDRKLRNEDHMRVPFYGYLDH